MQLPVKYTEKGYTLLEFMVAVLILTVGLLAVLTSIEIAMKQNQGNKTRNDAVVLAEQFLANIRSVPYADLNNNDPLRQSLGIFPSHPVTRTLPTGAVTKTYTIITNIDSINGTNSSRASVEVRWLEKGDTGVANGQIYHSHSVSSTVSNTLP